MTATTTSSAKPTLSIDIETYSSADLKKSGVYRYAEAPDFTILLIAYATDDGPVTVLDVQAGDDTTDIRRMLTSGQTIKTAFNAQFERVCLEAYFGQPMPPEQWRCTMVHALELGLPGTLEQVAQAMQLDQQKDARGKRLLRTFTVPNQHGERNRPDRTLTDSDWDAFKDYCKQDVEVERAIRRKLERFPLPESEWNLWQLDQHINQTGVQIDPVLIAQAIRINALRADQLQQEAVQITGLQNPNSLQQLKAWLKDAEGIDVETLTKQSMPDILKQVSTDDAKRMMAIRQELAKTSTAKYSAMHASKCADNRIRGLLQFYGAGRTGRWAGRLVQVQNLPGNRLTDLPLARSIVRRGDEDTLDMLYGDVSDVLSQLIRTAFVPRSGHRFIVADFSAIEARVIAWLANERWRLDVFQTHGKIYEASAAQMFGVPMERIGKGSPLRQKGKVAELALGYQGGPNALVAMGALKMGLTEDELPDIVSKWRSANPAIVTLWSELEQAMTAAITLGKRVGLHRHGHYPLTFKTENNVAFIRLPSGRRLAYVQPELQPHPTFKNKNQITYKGVDQYTRKWTRLNTYGGKLTENVVQAIARDCLAESLIRLQRAGLRTVMHVHDEVVLEVPNGQSGADEVAAIMAQPIPWAPELPLRADAFETDYYKKD